MRQSRPGRIVDPTHERDAESQPRGGALRGLLSAALLAVAPLARAEIIVEWRAPNCEVEIGLSDAAMEDLRPGDQIAPDLVVAEVRDADFLGSGNGRDWLGNVHDGSSTQVWLRWAGHSLFTTTTASTTAVSVHLQGDDNDGRCRVSVDGAAVAILDMNNPVTRNARVIVRGLPRAPHTLAVDAIGCTSQQCEGWQKDVAVWGGTALEQCSPGAGPLEQRLLVPGCGSVAIDGDRAVVGIPGAGAGAARVLKLEDGRWIEDQLLEASNGVEGDKFGAAVAIDGDLIVVGAPEGGYARSFGLVYVFRHDGSSWAEEETMWGVIRDFRFGSSVAAGDDLVVVAGGLLSEPLFVFGRVGGDWVMLQEVVGKFGVGYGNNLSMDGSRLAIGLPFRDFGDGGAVDILRFDGSLFVDEVVNLRPSERERSNGLGWSVALRADRLVVGAPRKNDGGTRSGAAYVFRNSAAGWVEEAKLRPGDLESLDYFGESVALLDGLAVVGAPGLEKPADAPGKVSVFLRSGTSWSESLHPWQELLPPRAGLSVGASGVFALASTGAPEDIVISFRPGAPLVSSIEPLSGELRGGTEVTIRGHYLSSLASVFFGSARAQVLRWEGPETLVVSTPRGPSEGASVPISIGQDGGIADPGCTFTYLPNEVDIEVQGNPRRGSTMRITVYGPANTRCGLGLGPEGPYTHRGSGLTLCFARPSRLDLFLKPRQLSTGPLGEVEVQWTIPNDPSVVFQSKVTQAGVLLGGGAIALTDCPRFTILP